MTKRKQHKPEFKARVALEALKGERTVAELVTKQDGWANIPPKSNRTSPICFSPWLYKQRNLIERFFNKLKYYIRIATRHDKLGSTFLAMAKLACIRLRLRQYESTA